MRTRTAPLIATAALLIGGTALIVRAPEQGPTILGAVAVVLSVSALVIGSPVRLRWQRRQPRWHWTCRRHPGDSGSARRLSLILRSARLHLRVRHGGAR